MDSPEQRTRFEGLVLPHLSAAYNLARWLVRNPQDAEDLVQEASMKAFRSFDAFRGGDCRAWLLAIVRNSCYTFLGRRRKPEEKVEFDEQQHSSESAAATQESILIAEANRESLKQALEELSVEFREAIVLRELEGLSYREISDLTEVPVGTVMSRLSRGRQQLRERFAPPLRKEGRA